MQSASRSRGEADDFFWADELFVSTADSVAAAGKLTGRHLAFQAKDRATVDAFHKAGLAAGGVDNGTPGERAATTPATTPPSCSTPTATTSRRSITVKRNSARCVKVSF